MSAPIFIDVATVKAQIARLRTGNPDVDADATLLEIALEGETDLHELLTKLLRMEREAIAFAAAIEQQTSALEKRALRFCQQRDRCRAMMLSLLEASSQQRVRLPEATISIAADRAGCVITDEAALPAEFVELKRFPKKKEILAALLEGQRVSGAERKNTGTHLAIRI